jgi:acyl transferase domain-containing protein
VQYVEAHGTGTTLGDPIEVLAMDRAFCQQRNADNPLYLGSVKTNFGHLEGAAGVAGLIKVVLALQHRVIPPHLHLENPNPYISWQKMPLRIPQEATPWPGNGDSRFAGVSSFGMSGTNVHIILEEAKPTASSDESRPHQLILLSAKTIASLEAVTENLEEALKSEPHPNLADIAYTLSKGRQAYPYRRILVASETGEILQGNYLEGREDRPKAVVFMFSGQGSQSVNMGLDLYQTEPRFRQQVDRCAELLQPLIGKDLRQILYPATATPAIAEQLRQTEMTQCALFVVEYAIAQLWIAWGVKPAALVGHSIGEYVAACLSGVLSLEDALFLVARRGQLMQQMPPGQMLALMGDEATVRSLMANFTSESDLLSLAVINSASQCVVAGEASTLEAFQQYCKAQGITGRCLNTSHAFHSHMMNPIVGEFVAQVEQLPLHPPQIPYLSNVTGTWIVEEQATDPNYWGQHLRSCVRFADNLQELSQNPDYLLLEVGPGQTLSQLARRQNIQPASQILASLPQGDGLGNYPGLKHLLSTLGQLWLAGVNIQWERFYEGQNRQILSLPSYPFERQRYWIDTEAHPQTIQSSVVPTRAAAQIPVVLQARPSTLNSDYVAPRSQTEKELTRILEESLGIGPIGIEDNFFDLGGDSLLAIQIVSRLSQDYQIALNQSQLLETPTIAQLALLLEAGHNSESLRSSPLIAVRASRSQTPLFLVHPASGSAYSYLHLSNYLDPQQSIYAIEDPGLHSQQSPQSVPDKACAYLDLIRSVQPHGPYHLAGYSYGGNMALEMAIQLSKAGETVEFLGMLDSFPPCAYENIFIDDTRLLAALWHMTGLIFNKQSRDWLAELRSVAAEGQVKYVLRQLAEDSSGIPLPQAFLQESTIAVAMDNFRQLHHYVPQEVYSGQITYFWAEEKIPASLRDLLNYQIPDDLIGDGWGKLATQPIKTYFVPGHHFTMFEPSHLPILAQQFQRAFQDLSLSKKY